MAVNKDTGIAEAPQDSDEEVNSLSMFMDEPEPEVEEAEESEDEAEEEGEEEESEEEAEESEETEDESEEDEDTEDGDELDIESISADDKVSYLDQLYKSLDDDARKEWLSGNGGRIGKDVGKFRKERAQALKDKDSAISERDEAQAKYEALVVQSKTNNSNPFASLVTDDAISEKEKTITSELDAVEKWLDSDEDYLTIGEKEYSAREVARWPVAYGKQLQLLKEQKKAVGKLSGVKEKTKEVEAELEESYTWLKDKDSTEFEKYQKLRKDPNWARVLDFVPELAEELPKVLAKYASDTKAVLKPKKGLRIKGARKPKGDLGDAGGSSLESGTKHSKALKAAANRLANGTATESDKLSMFL